MTQALEDYTLTCQDVAEKLGYHVQYVRYIASKGKIPAIKRGRLWLFSEREILEYYKNKTKEAISSDGDAEKQTGVDDLVS